MNTLLDEKGHEENRLLQIKPTIYFFYLNFSIFFYLDQPKKKNIQMNKSNTVENIIG